MDGQKVTNIREKNIRKILEKISQNKRNGEPDFLLIKNKLGKLLKQKLFSGEIELGLAQEIAVYITKTFQKQVSRKKIIEELVNLNQLFPQLNIQLADFSYE